MLLIDILSDEIGFSSENLHDFTQNFMAAETMNAQRLAPTTPSPRVPLTVSKGSATTNTRYFAHREPARQYRSELGTQQSSAPEAYSAQSVVRSQRSDALLSPQPQKGRGFVY